jgi:tight adherence protein B
VVTGLLLLALGLVLSVPAPAAARVRLGRRVGDPARLIARLRTTRASHAGLIEVLGGFRDELRSGGGLREAFEKAAGDGGHPAIARALATSRLGGDVPAALRDGGTDQPVVLSLAALWEVSENSGAALADALDRLVHGAEQAERVRREVGAQLAGPRATVRVLALLPLVGLGMGLLMGADPLGFLLTTPWGWGCLVVAGVLEVAGVVWMRRLVSGIEAHL